MQHFYKKQTGINCAQRSFKVFNFAVPQCSEKIHWLYCYLQSPPLILRLVVNMKSNLINCITFCSLFILETEYIKLKTLEFFIWMRVPFKEFVVILLMFLSVIAIFPQSFPALWSYHFLQITALLFIFPHYDQLLFRSMMNNFQYLITKVYKE